MATGTAPRNRLGVHPTIAPRPGGGESAPRAVTALLFLYGASQFFVDPEPGLPELLFPILLFFTTQRGLFAAPHLLLFAGNLFAVTLELLIFRTATWSLLSVYMTLISVSLYSILTRYNVYKCTKSFLLGGAFGSAATLAVLATPWADQAYRYGIRFTGFFKDPNVTAPTALFFAFALFAIRDSWRWAAIAPIAVFMISLSRSTYLAAAVGLFYCIAFRNRITSVFGTIVAAVATLLASPILDLVDRFFQSIGRQGVFNDYDNDRASNWLELIRQSWESGAPLGPTYSELNGMSAHSTYIRLLVEQGPLVLMMFVAALWMAWKGATSIAVRAALVSLAVNAIVIDATHWRVLFIAIAMSLAWRGDRPLARPGARRRYARPAPAHLRPALRREHPS